MKHGRILLQALLSFASVFGLVLSMSGCGTSLPATPVTDVSSPDSATALNTPTPNVTPMVVTGGSHTVGLKSDGTVVAVGHNYYGQCDVGGWTDITQVATGGYHTVGLRSDGTVVAVGYDYYGQCDIGGWADIIQITAGYRHTVGLEPDGTVLAVGWNDDGQCNVGSWTDIVQVAAGRYHTVGLKSDGTVVAVGDNQFGQSNVSGWTDITQVAAGDGHTVGLKSDGTVVAVGDNRSGQCDAASWEDITQVAAGYSHTVGLKSDGTVLTVGGNYWGQCNVGSWTDIVQVAAGSSQTVALRSDGTAVGVGYHYFGQCNVSDWTDINQIASYSDQTLGLKPEGTVVAVGSNFGLNSHGRLNVIVRRDIVQVAAYRDHTVELKADGTVIAVGDDYGHQWKVVGGWTDITQVATGEQHTVGLKSDGTVVAAGAYYNDNGQLNVSNWTDIVQVAAGYLHTVGIKSDGTAVAVGWNDGGQCEVDGWTDIIQVAAGFHHTVGVKADGTVVAVGSNANGECNVSNWTNIVQVAAGHYHTVGLKSDGTVVAAGSNYSGQCNVSGWTNIIQVAAGDRHTVGLKSDGTVVAAGYNYYGQCNVTGWTNITQVAAGYGHTVGLRSDGTVVAVGYDYYGQCSNADGWTDIAQVAAYRDHTVGLKSDGTVVAVGWNYYGQCNVGDWTDIVQVAAGYDRTVGLKSDGTVVSTDALEDVSGWADIIQIAAGGHHTVGLKSDGTVVAVGHNYYGECNVSDWTDIVQVAAGEEHTVGLKSDGTVVAACLEVELAKWNLGEATPQENKPVADFDLSPSYPFCPVVDQEITLDASGSTPSDGASTITGYLWEFDDGTAPVGTTSPICTHTYPADLLSAGSSERHFTVVLTVMDDLGRTDSATFDLTVKRPPVLLVHGFQLTSFELDDIWGDMAEYLTGQSVKNDDQYDWLCLGTGPCDPDDPGFDPDFAMKRLEGNGVTVYISCYTHYTCDGTALDIETYADCLADEIQLITQEESVSQVDIVAHSMGGLVSRAYIEHEDLDGIQWYRNDIRKLVMLGTPNDGADIASLIPYIPGVPGDVIVNWPSVQQMKPDSGFLTHLNSGVTGQSQIVEYSAIAGNFYRCGSLNPGCFPPTHYFCITGALLCTLFGEDNDGLVHVSSVRLDEIPESTAPRFFIRDMNHTELCRLTSPMVRPILNAPSFSQEPIPVPDLYLGRLFSPGELRVYDSEGRITGLVDGQAVEDIPDSSYDDLTNKVMIFSTNNSYHWKVVGTGEGTYGLEITYQHDGETTTFLASAIPMTDAETHQYSINWEALSKGEEGVTVQTDSDGDGTIDDTLISGKVLAAVETATGTGTAWFTSSNGMTEDLEALCAIPPGAPAGVTFPHGLFSFTVKGLELGQEVTMTIEVPQPVPKGTKWWKYHNGLWDSVDIGSDNGDNIITITLKDGGTGDFDDLPRQITDPGGPGNPGGSVGWETHPISKSRVLLPWIALFSALIAGATLLALRRRRSTDHSSPT